MTGSRVADDQKRWVRDHVPGADLSIYHPRAMWRLPYAIHEKAPGNLKVLIESVPGRALVIPPSPPAPPPVHTTDTTPSRDAWMNTITRRCGAGERSTNLFVIAKTAVALGIPLEEATRQALWWNDRFSEPPHPVPYVALKVAQAYRQLGG